MEEKLLKINDIEIRSTVIYGDAAEQFVVALPHYDNAYKIWLAKSRGVDSNQTQKMGDLGLRYRKLKEQLDAIEGDATKQKQIDDLSRQIMDVGLELTQLDGLSQALDGLTDDQLKEVDQARAKLTSIKNEILLHICDGIMKEDRKTPLLDIEDVLKWTAGQKDLLIWQVAANPENAIPTDFLARLNQIVHPVQSQS